MHYTKVEIAEECFFSKHLDFQNQGALNKAKVKFLLTSPSEMGPGMEYEQHWRESENLYGQTFF